ncbi:MAG: SusC/RagA family TonB-linked outer membrane protein [Bacteroidales bacterium]
MKRGFYLWRHRASFATACLLMGLAAGVLSPTQARAESSSEQEQLMQSQSSVRGTVVDDSGQPLPGATVAIKGTTTGAITDVDGNFELHSLKEGDILVFTFIGLETQEVAFVGQATLAIQMAVASSQMDEVVVVGYGVQRKEAVTGSVASVGAEQIQEVASANVTQALQGRVAGVEMTQVSSQPGAAMQIQIRGARSLTASNEPLIVLDGIPFAGTINDINPVDIKSMDILKDASATAIYGSRGANGVILITTNNGKKGQAAKVSYNMYTGVRTIFSKYPMMDGPAFAKLREYAGLFTNSIDESYDNNTDWQDLNFKKGIMTSHDLGVQGGTDKGSYSFNAGYFKDGGVVPLQNYERFSLRGSLDQEVGKYVKLGFVTNNNFSTTNGGGIGIVYNALNASPIANPYNEDGSLKPTYMLAGGASYTYTRDRMESLGDGYADKNEAFASYNTLYGEVKIPGVEGLKYRMNVGLSYRSTKRGTFKGEGVMASNVTNPSSGSLAYSDTKDWAIENIISYDRVFADKHSVSLVGLYSMQENTYTRTRISGRGIPGDALQYHNLGMATDEIKVDPNEQIYNRSGLISYMGRAMYSYDNKYMISATFRSDASSRLADGHKWHSYPAISAGWNIGSEGFMENVSWVDVLKLRVGYGQTSNQSIAPYKTLGLLSSIPYNFGADGFETGYYVTELSNPALGWEYSSTVNYGLDFTLLNNRLSGTFEYYVQDTKDVLLSLGLPSTAGVGSYTANIGSTQNKGFELSLNGVIIDNKNGWTWEAGLNLYANRNELKELASGQKRDEANGWFVGYNINSIYDYENIGLWQESDPDYQFISQYEPSAGASAGMIKARYTGEFNADGSPEREIGPDDRQILEMDPDFQGGFSTRVAYKNFDLNIIGAFKSGGILISSLHSSAGYLNMLSAKSGNNVDVDYWTPDNIGAKYPDPKGLRSGDNPKYGSTMGYFDASYVKIRTITLGYNFEQNWVRNIGISRLRAYATIQNPFVIWSPYYKETGMDPEPNSRGNENTAVASAYNGRFPIIGTNTPATRNFLFGLNVTF